MDWHLLIHFFLFIMFCISPVFPLYLSLSRMQNGFRKTTPMNMNESCVSQRFLFVTQIRVVNEIIYSLLERLEVSLQKLFPECEWKLACFKGLRSWHGFVSRMACFKGLRSWHGFVSRTKPFYSPTRWKRFHFKNFPNKAEEIDILIKKKKKKFLKTTLL